MHSALLLFAPASVSRNDAVTVGCLEGCSDFVRGLEVAGAGNTHPLLLGLGVLRRLSHGSLGEGVTEGVERETIRVPLKRDPTKSAQGS